MVIGGLLLIVAAFLLSNEQAADVPSQASENVNLPYSEVPRIELADANARLAAGSAIFLDVRTAEEYEDAHIPNAILMPFNEVATRYAELPLGAEILTYCT
jgi:3-mercaptopyruvate sulfurtransferase SseA